MIRRRRLALRPGTRRTSLGRHSRHPGKDTRQTGLRLALLLLHLLANNLEVFVRVPDEVQVLPARRDVLFLFLGKGVVLVEGFKILRVQLL